ncbi:DedA family protein [Noviherbaspirillum cavernae]|uniref:DedA family protein n=1 Tax=Noviherbaspirillum cavernae TaxID=2320862 RepID=A0A418X4H0_9BURK|nr:DedA family protein [Noviherbaspirillum cavernae]RJG07383.1 DedA family protein [Noviherbaspirillum cavernae]
MDVAGWVGQYGYAAIALGMFVEGEAVLLMGGVAAARGHLTLPYVIMVAAIAGFMADQACFHAGRHYGSALLSRFPSVQTRAEHVNKLLRRHQVPLILSIRFLYGLRTAGLIAIGMSGVSPYRFLVLDFISALAWATLIGCAGYFFGRAIMRLLAEASTHELWLAGGLLLAVSLSLLLLLRARATRAER